MSSSLAPSSFTLHLPSHVSKLGMLRCHAPISVSASSHPLHGGLGQHHHWIDRAPPIRSTATRTSTQLDAQEEETSKSKMKLAERWREIQGANDWEMLLDPIDDILRKEIIRYGEFAQACYDGFDFDPFSKYCGSWKFNPSELFHGVGLSDSGYQVTKYLYATSKINLPGVFQRPRVEKQWSTHANWMGFIAVATDEKEIRRLGRRDIVVAWRGTVTYQEWIADLMDSGYCSHYPKAIPLWKPCLLNHNPKKKCRHLPFPQKN